MIVVYVVPVMLYECLLGIQESDVAISNAFDYHVRIVHNR